MHGMANCYIALHQINHGIRIVAGNLLDCRAAYTARNDDGVYYRVAYAPRNNTFCHCEAARPWQSSFCTASSENLLDCRVAMLLAMTGVDASAVRDDTTAHHFADDLPGTGIQFFFAGIHGEFWIFRCFVG